MPGPGRTCHFPPVPARAARLHGLLVSTAGADVKGVASPVSSPHLTVPRQDVPCWPGGGDEASRRMSVRATCKAREPPVPSCDCCTSCALAVAAAASRSCRCPLNLQASALSGGAIKKEAMAGVWQGSALTLQSPGRLRLGRAQAALSSPLQKPCQA